jgi:hypothetical protein
MVAALRSGRLLPATSFLLEPAQACDAIACEPPESSVERRLKSANTAAISICRRGSCSGRRGEFEKIACFSAASGLLAASAAIRWGSTEEQNLDERNNPAARIEEEGLEAAFGKQSQRSSKPRHAFWKVGT